MKKQARTIKTPCCKTRVRITFPRGSDDATYFCENCKKKYKVYFELGYGKSGRINKKEIMGETR